MNCICWNVIYFVFLKRLCDSFPNVYIILDLVQENDDDDNDVNYEDCGYEIHDDKLNEQIYLSN